MGVTGMLQRCNGDVTGLFKRVIQGCLGGFSADVTVTGVLPWCYMAITGIIRMCYRGVTWVLQLCYMGVRGVFQECTRVFLGCYSGVKELFNM